MTQSMALYGWVYNLTDYYQMFDLTEADLKKRLFDFPGGISSFNAELFQQGVHVVSGDASYDMTVPEITQKANTIFEANKTFLSENLERFPEGSDALLQQVFNQWLLSKQLFLADYEKGVDDHRYRCVTMPHLPFDDAAFGLALCSDFLAITQSTSHVTSAQLIMELCRIAEEVRIYPLMDTQGNMNEALCPVMLQLQQDNFGVEVREVAYEQQLGGNAMLRVWSKECAVSL